MTAYPDLTLTQRDLDYMDKLLKAGDRDGFYLSYYSAVSSVGNDELSDVGGVEMALQRA